MEQSRRQTTKAFTIIETFLKYTLAYILFLYNADIKIDFHSNLYRKENWIWPSDWMGQPETIITIVFWLFTYFCTIKAEAFSTRSTQRPIVYVQGGRFRGSVKNLKLLIQPFTNLPTYSFETSITNTYYISTT